MNDKSGVVVMLILAFVTIGVCAGTIYYINASRAEVIDEVDNVNVELVIEEEEHETDGPASIENDIGISVPKAVKITSTEDKKSKAAEEWEEAGKELNDLYQGSKMQELIKKKMTEGNKQWFSELFEKYDISPENQEVIASSVTEAQTNYFNELMANGFLKDADDEKRAEVAEKLLAIDDECETEIEKAGGEAFLAESKEKRKTELREQYLNKVDYRLGKNKMTDDQRTAMNSLYEVNQVTESEVWTLPRNEIDKRKANIESGAKSILDEKQYENFVKKNRNPFNFK